MNAITKTQSNPFLVAAQGMVSAGKAYMRFNGNTGVFTVGADRDLVNYGTRFAVNPNSIKSGWICWNNGEVVDEKMFVVAEGHDIPTHASQLPDHSPYGRQSDGWSRQLSCEMRNVETGQEIEFKVKGAGCREMAKIIQAYGRRMVEVGDASGVPVIELGAYSYMPKDKSFGQKFVPTLEIVEWADEAELMAGLDDNDPENYEPRGVDMAQLAKDVEEVETEEAPAPSRRRRRRSVSFDD